jgi:predicted Zn-dependent protease
MPFFNVRFLGITLLVVLLAAGGVFGWRYYQGRPDTLLQSAKDYYAKAEKAREAKDTANAKANYEKGQTAIEQFLANPKAMGENTARASEAQLLRYKIMRPLARIVDSEAADNPEQKRKALAIHDEAFRAGERAAAIDSNNVEAQAAVLEDHFRRNDFKGAYPYARALIDSRDKIPAEVAQRDDMNSDILGAYYVLTLRDLEENHPDEALKHLDQSREQEERWAASHPGSSQGIPRWRAALLEVQALQQKIDLLRKQTGSSRPGAGSPREDARKTEERLNAAMQKYVDRARNELKATIPAGEGKPEMPTLALLSETNCNGLIELLLMSLRTADGFAAVQDRSELLLDVCEKLGSATGAQPYIYRDAVHGATQLRVVNGSLQPADKRLKPEEMAKAQERVVTINDAVLKNGGTIDPLAYLEMSKVAMAEKDGRARALGYANKGLEVARLMGLTVADRRVVELHAQAAWLLLLDHKVKEADEHLADVAKNQRLVPNVSYMQGLGAVLDGRLEEGVKKLKEAQKSPRLQDALPLLLGLAHAYMGMGQTENAVPVLEKIHTIYKQQQAKNRDDEPWINTWLPTLQHVNVALLKDHLALSLSATDQRDAVAHFQKAKDAFNELKGTYVAEEAISAMIDYQVARLRVLEARQPGSLDGDVIRKDIQQMVKDLPAGSRDDPRLLWSQVNVILSQRVMDPATVAAALVAPLGAPTDLAVRLGEVGRIRAGYNFETVKAEEFLTQAAAKQPDSLTLQLAWVRWLLNNRRPAEALAKLSELENKALKEEDRRRLKAFRAQVMLASGQSQEAGKILKDLRENAGDDLSYLDLWVEELLRSGDVKQAEDVVKNVLSKHDQSGLAFFSQGQVRQAAGDFAQAIQSYQRSMEFAQYKTASQGGLLSCVLGIASGPAGKPEKANPQAAFDEAKRLRKEHPADPTILLAYAITARLMDEVYGDAGMEGALADLLKVYKEQQPAHLTSASFVAAQQWIAAGRPDRARQELKAFPGHLPSLAQATRLAINDGDWAEVEADIKRMKQLQPNAKDLSLWEASLDEARGRTTEAKKIYEQFVKEGAIGQGYLGLARLHEHAKEYKEALELIKKWRKEQPDEVNGAVATVRVLCRDGQAAEGVKEADAFVKGQLARLRQDAEEQDRKNPPKDKDEAERRAKARAASLVAVEMLLDREMYAAFQGAKAWPEAEKWLTERIGPLVEKLPEANRKAARLNLKMMLGTAYMEEGRLKKENSPERAKFMDLALRQYDEVWQALPGDLIAGNNLAWLLVKEKKEGPRALALVEEVRKGKYSQKPISAERLPLEFLDTLGVVYGLNGQKQEALNLFKDAMQQYANEPRIVMHLAQAQKALGMKLDAFATYKKTIDLADERAKTTPDPDRKAALTQLIDEARAEQQKLNVLQ